MRTGNTVRFKSAQAGFTMAAVLAALLILSLATQGVMTYVSQQAQREREADLISVGQAYATAIAAYYELSPGGVKRWPRSLEDLVEDKRFVGTRRHLREVYPDPITRTADWGIVSSTDGGIAGIYSKSGLRPIHTAPVELAELSLPAAGSYGDWQFVYRPPLFPSRP